MICKYVLVHQITISLQAFYSHAASLMQDENWQALCFWPHTGVVKETLLSSALPEGEIPTFRSK